MPIQDAIERIEKNKGSFIVHLVGGAELRFVKEKITLKNGRVVKTSVVRYRHRDVNCLIWNLIEGHMEAH